MPDGNRIVVAVERYLSPKELSERWEGRISVKTLANWRCAQPEPYGPRFRRFGNKILYAVSAVEAFERSNEFASTVEYNKSKAEPANAVRQDDLVALILELQYRLKAATEELASLDARSPSRSRNRADSAPKGARRRLRQR